MRKKVEDGWFPHKPPIGYLNNKHQLPNFTPIYKDPDRSAIIKQLWDTLIKKQGTVKSI